MRLAELLLQPDFAASREIFETDNHLVCFECAVKEHGFAGERAPSRPQGKVGKVTCFACQASVTGKLHTNDCHECNEIVRFGQDFVRLAELVIKRGAEASNSATKAPQSAVPAAYEGNDDASSRSSDAAKCSSLAAAPSSSSGASSGSSSDAASSSSDAAAGTVADDAAPFDHDEDLLARAHSVARHLVLLADHQRRDAVQRKCKREFMVRTLGDESGGTFTVVRDYWSKLYVDNACPKLGEMPLPVSVEGFVISFVVPERFSASDVEKNKYLPDNVEAGGLLQLCINLYADNDQQTWGHASRNWELVAEMLSARYPWLRDALVMADGAHTYSYNSAPSTAYHARPVAAGKIRIAEVCHNEPGHAANTGDANGATVSAEIFKKGKSTQPTPSAPKITAADCVSFAQQSTLKAQVHRLVQHPESDPLAVKGAMLPVGVQDVLHKAAATVSARRGAPRRRARCCARRSHSTAPKPR